MHQSVLTIHFKKRILLFAVKYRKRWKKYTHAKPTCIGRTDRERRMTERKTTWEKRTTSPKFVAEAEIQGRVMAGKGS